MKTRFHYKAFELVMLQPTSFCNIQCDYCYLDINNRGQKNKMSFETLEKICDRIFSSSLIQTSKDITFMWHEGEPLVMPLQYYEQALEIINRYSLKAPHVKVYQSILTNATLINDKWCDFFKMHNFSVGVSVDGPELIHDVHRKTRNGKGTFASVVKGIETLRRNQIEPYFLTTIHLETLKYPKQLFEFYKSQGVKWVGFNFEEIVGNNKKSSLQRDINLANVKDFINEFYSLYKNHDKLFLREFENMRFAIVNDTEISDATLDTISPYSILTVNYKGDFSTFAPELMDIRNDKFQDFVFGNVFHHSIEETMQTDKFKSVYSDIQEGVDACRASCEYFGVCGSNLPAHKISENGTFNSTNTLYCNAAIKSIADKIIDELSLELSHI